MSELLKVFVYGTLKVGGRFAKKFDDLRVSVKPGTVKGTLFNINKAFPGLVLEGDTEVIGEVHEYENPEAVKHSLDAIEGYYGPGDSHNLYDIKEVEVVTADGTETCKVYVFAKRTDNFDVVANGEWEL